MCIRENSDTWIILYNNIVLNFAISKINFKNPLIQLCTKKIRFPSSPLMVLSQSRAEGFKSKPALKDHLPSKICHTFKLLTLRGCVCDTVLRSCITLDFFSFCGCVCDVFKILQNSALVWMCL